MPVKYVDQATGEAFYTATAQCMKGGSVTVEVDLSQAQGYTLVSEASVQVSADANGTLTPAEAVFTFAKEQQAVKAPSAPPMWTRPEARRRAADV